MSGYLMALTYALYVIGKRANLSGDIFRKTILVSDEIEYSVLVLRRATASYVCCLPLDEQNLFSSEYRHEESSTDLHFRFVSPNKSQSILFVNHTEVGRGFRNY